ncbi:MAG TPA: hemerythrin domain-containing protein [Polyangiaceae bacterium]|nr:hemerythrin domain-containing protein [Polyangiaceae bacterium]
MPVRTFEHSHTTLTKLALEVGEMIRAEASHPPTHARLRKRLMSRLGALREQLIQHFANEEEALFPFVRETVPARADTVDRLQDSHDLICGSLMRLVHLVEHDRHAFGGRRPTLVGLYERFENAYAEHAQEEGALFEALGRALNGRKRRELAERLQGL